MKTEDSPRVGVSAHSSKVEICFSYDRDCYPRRIPVPARQNERRGTYRAQKGRVKEACKRNNVIVWCASRRRASRHPRPLLLCVPFRREEHVLAKSSTPVYWTSTGSLCTRVKEWDTGAGPVGSTDIKICGHAGREVTRFFIVVQVQRDSEWNT